MNNLDIDFNKIFEAIINFVKEPSFYLQLIAIVMCFLLTFLCYELVKRLFFPKLKDPNFGKESHFNSVIAKYSLPLILPGLMMIFLSIGTATFHHFYSDVLLFSNTILLIALFLFLRFLRIFSESNLMANLIGIFLVPAIILDTIDLLEPTISYLDSYDLQIGAFRISIYTATKAFLVLMVVFWLSGLVAKKSKAYITSNKGIKSSTKGIISKIIDILIYFTVLVAILKVFGVDMTTLAVLGGAVGVGIGFGLQKIASNFISGIILLFEKSVEIGDLVELDGGKIVGIVTYFGGRHTLVEQGDGKEVMVPNEEFIINKVTNLTYNHSRGRIEIGIGISYDSDVKKAQELMIQTAKEHPRCLRYPVAECHVVSFSDNAIELIMYFWVSNVLEGRLQPKSDVMINILQKFKDNNIKIPVPQRDINIKDYNALLPRVHS